MVLEGLEILSKQKFGHSTTPGGQFLNQTVILFFFPTGQLHVDDYERRKSNAKSFLAEETGFIIFASGNFSPISLNASQRNQTKSFNEPKNSNIKKDNRLDSEAGPEVILTPI